MTPSSTVAPIRGALRAVTLACVPAARSLSPEGWARAEAIVGGQLAERPPAVRRQVTLFARVLGLMALLRFGRPLDRLEPRRTLRLLRGLERSPVLLLRRGTWGLRTLAFMGYYGQPEVRDELGYAAALRGWESGRDRPGAWPERGGAAPPEPGTLTADGVAGGGAGHD